MIIIRIYTFLVENYQNNTLVAENIISNSTFYFGGPGYHVTLNHNHAYTKQGPFVILLSHVYLHMRWIHAMTSHYFRGPGYHVT